MKVERKIKVLHLISLPCRKKKDKHEWRIQKENGKTAS